MTVDNPPQDNELVDLLNASDNGLTPTEVIKAFEEKGYSYNQVIEALQRVIERGRVEFTSGARLIAFQEQRKAFA